MTKEKKKYYYSYIKIIVFFMLSFGMLWVIHFLIVGNQTESLLINEICSDNFNLIMDENGKYSDYIEIYNTSNKQISMDNWYLVNKRKSSKKYVFHNVVIEPKSYYVVFPTEQGNFSVSKDGDGFSLINNNARVIDSVDTPKLLQNQVYARVTDGNHNWKIMSGTPGESNALGKVVFEKILDSPEFSKESGFYNSSFELKIASFDTVYYTLDGTEPTRNSNRYQGPISIWDISNTENQYASDTAISTAFLLEDSPYILSPEPVDKATIVKAKAFDAFGGESEVVTKVYFIGYDKKKLYENFPVISIETDPDNLFGYENGIYTRGVQFDTAPGDRETLPWYWWNANYRMSGRAWERPVHVDYFDADKNLILSQEAGIRIKGGGSRGHAQKSMNLFAREVYNGENEFENYFFKNDTEEASVTLFSGGDDGQSTKIKDKLIGELMSNRDIATMESFPCYVFLCGEYWGIYNITENYDTTYIESHYQVEEDNVVMIKNGELQEGKASDIKLYQDLLDFVEENDLADDSNYLQFCDMVDIQSLMDYYGCQIYIARCADWPASNYALWRSRTISKKQYEDGKWRWMLFDVNSDSMLPDLMHENTIVRVMNEDTLFAAVMRNRYFRKDFYNNFIELTHTTFDTDKLLIKLQKYQNLYQEPMGDYYQRFFYDKYNDSLFLYYMDNLMKFYSGRTPFIERDVRRACTY